ncbi:hypothetical protein NHQ30_002252 [Ciborinia camelliae]|nr:hypothetical protein NHQ30_002252 [Ciborinia camelliae]
MLTLRIQPRSCSSLLKKARNISATRTFGTSRVLLAGVGRQAGAPLICAAKGNMQRISAHRTPLLALGSGTRGYAVSTPADDIIEGLTEQHSLATDQFEIACKETEKKSVWATDDRAAAVEEFLMLKEMYVDAIEGEHGEEVKRRVGQRFRELEQGVKALEERAMEDH